MESGDHAIYAAFLEVLYAVALALSAWFFLLCLTVRSFNVRRIQGGLPPLQRVELGVHLFSASVTIFLADLALLLFHPPEGPRAETATFSLLLLAESTLVLARSGALSVLAYSMYRYLMLRREMAHPDESGTIQKNLEMVYRAYRTNLVCWGFIFFCHLLFFSERIGSLLQFLNSVNLYRLWETAILIVALSALPRGDAQVRWRFHVALVCWLFTIVSHEIRWLSALFHIAAVSLLLYAVIMNQLEQRLSLNETRMALTRELDVILNFLAAIAADSQGEERERETASADELIALDRFAVDRVLRVTLDFAMDQVGANAGCIFLLGDSQEGEGGTPRPHLVPHEVHGLYPPRTDISGMDYVAVKQRFLKDLVRNERIPVGETLVGQVAASGRPVLLEGSDAATQFPHHGVDYLIVRSAMVLPLIAGGKVEGVLSLLKVGAEPTATPFTQTDLKVIRSLVDQASIAIRNANVLEDLREKERLERDIQLAQDVQRLLLPEQCPTSPGLEFAALCRSAYRVGGDYYDFVHIENRYLVVVVADVSGKGVPGALAMAMVRSTLVAQAQHCSSAKELLNLLNHFICRDLRKDMFVSMLLAVVDTVEHRMSVCRAGHEPLLRLRGANGLVEEIAPGGIALGLDASGLFSETLEEQRFPLEKGDIYIFYTDGVTEAQNERREEFTLSRFIETVRRVRHQSAAEIAQEIDRRVTEFTGNVPQHDDLTLVILRVLEDKTGTGAAPPTGDQERA